MKLIKVFSVICYFVLPLIPAWNSSANSEILNFISLHPDNSTLSSELLKRYKYFGLGKEMSETTSLEVEELIQELDFKRFLKEIPLPKLRKLKSLFRVNPEAGQDYLLHLAKDLKYRENKQLKSSLNKSSKCSNITQNENGSQVKAELQNAYTTRRVNSTPKSNQPPKKFDPKNDYKFKLNLSEKTNFRTANELHSGFIPSKEFKVSPEIIQEAINKYSSQPSKIVKEGSYGPFSWSIEPATLEMLQGETLLSPTTILNAIVQAENEQHFSEKNQHNPSSITRFPDKKKSEMKRNENHSSHNVFSKYLTSSLSQPDPYDKNSLTSAYSQPSTVNYSPTTYSAHSKPEHYYNTNEAAPIYYSDPEYEMPWSTSNKWDSVGDLIWKAKSIFQGVSTGGYKPDAFTRKLLEITIGVLAFLAFGGYIATLIFQSLLPTLRPVISNKINKKRNITATNGLLGLLLGRSIRNEISSTPDLLPLDYIISTFIQEIISKDLE